MQSTGQTLTHPVSRQSTAKTSYSPRHLFLCYLRSRPQPTNGAPFGRTPDSSALNTKFMLSNPHHGSRTAGPIISLSALIKAQPETARRDHDWQFSDVNVSGERLSGGSISKATSASTRTLIRLFESRLFQNASHVLILKDAIALVDWWPVLTRNRVWQSWIGRPNNTS